MKICPICAERFPDSEGRCPTHRDRPLLRLGVEHGDGLVGRVVDGRYLVLERLGEGAMGTVYKAWQQRVNRVVAVKVMRPGLADADVRARFAREAEATARLKSPHTVAVYDSGELDDGTLYLAMEYIGGRTLADVLETEGPIPLGRLVPLALQLCESLAEAHALGLVHRDIKPTNLMVSERGGHEHLTVLDFGVVKLPDLAAHKLTREGMTVGSLSYMSPEQIDGRDVRLASDLYAVGVSLFQLATGELPFSAPTTVALMYKHISEPAPHLTARLGGTASAAAFDAIIQHLLRKRPEERFDSASALRTALSSVPLDARRAVAGATRPPLRTRSPTRPVGADTDPAQLRGVSVDDVHRRVTATRLAAAGAESRPRGQRARTARLVAFGVAVALGLWVVLDALLSG